MVGDVTVSMNLVYVLLGFMALVLVIAFTVILVAQQRMGAAVALLAEANKNPAALTLVESAMQTVVPADLLRDVNEGSKRIIALLELVLKDPAVRALVAESGKLIEQVTDGKPNVPPFPVPPGAEVKSSPGNVG